MSRKADPNKEKIHYVNIQVKESELAKLDKAAQQMNMNRSQLLRAFVHALDEQEKPAEQKAGET
jgi:metal-responsive CopG/Arc/MetJ family transcriptional regulator